MRSMEWLKTKPRVAGGTAGLTPGWFSVVKLIGTFSLWGMFWLKKIPSGTA